MVEQFVDNVQMIPFSRPVLVNQLVYFLRNFRGAWVTAETLSGDRYGSEDSKNMFGLVWNLVGRACVTAEVENF